MAHNGGLSQVGIWYSQLANDYRYINPLKSAQAWELRDNSGFPHPDWLDSNGYPSSQLCFTNDGGVDHGGVYTVFYFPTQTARPGNYVVKAIGTGTISAGFPTTSVSGSLTGVNPRYVFTPTGTPDANGSLRASIGISASSAGNLITSLQFCHVDDEAAMDAGAIFSPVFILKMQELNAGCVRFMDGYPTNTSNITTWATRKPLSYVYYDGDEYRASVYGGKTTNSSDDYSLAFSGFVLADKATVILQFNSDCAGDNPTLNVNGTGAVPIANRYGGNISFAGVNRPVANRWTSLVYDADLNVWIKSGGDGANGNTWLQNGAPPEILIQLCNILNAHPWCNTPFLSTDPITNFASSYATYVKENLNAGLIPRFEPINEIFNSADYGTNYGGLKSQAHWGTSDFHEWYGKILSTMGQAVSAVYSDDRTKYEVMCGVWTSVGSAGQNSRLTSAKYVSVNGGSAAFNWATKVAMATYVNSYYANDPSESTMADAWAAATGATKDAIMESFINDFQTTRVGLAGSKTTLFQVRALTVDYAAWGAGYGLTGVMSYEGGWSPDYPGVSGNVLAMRMASKLPRSVQSLTAQMMNNFIADGGTGPSQYQFSGPTQAWSLYDQTIFSYPSPAFDAIVTFNGQKGLRLAKYRGDTCAELFVSTQP